ncbi:Protein-L-isoaspartate O-methyltransferase [Planctomycetales bacterium 10988]|nr:Protein-L-isoaspartate O-methyltransferase [Planctomycetales bacterium 10988]
MNTSPSRLTDDEQQAQERMVREQLEPRKINDERVLAAMRTVPRSYFVPRDLAIHATEDRALPIECEQTISQPYIVALMTQAMELKGTERVLEIGTGSGYQTAILAHLAQSVFSIERHQALAEVALRRLKELGYSNVSVFAGDGTLGLPDKAPFDRILVTAGGPQTPPALFDQLAEGGRMIIPVGDEQSQVLRVIQKIDGEAYSRDISGCRFVKLVGAQGWQKPGSRKR